MVCDQCGGVGKRGMLGPPGFGILNRYCMSCWSLAEGVPSVEPAQADDAQVGDRQVELLEVPVGTQGAARVPAWLRRSGLQTQVNDTATAAPTPGVVFSVKCGLHEAASDVAIEMMREMMDHRGFSDYRFCFPNAFGGSSCERSAGADLCLGLCGAKCCFGEACDGNNGRSRDSGVATPCGELADDAVTDHSCWAHAFRIHQRHARRNPRGVMIQVVEVQEGAYVLGNGQRIEAEMAHSERLKTFRLHVRSPDHVRPHVENLSKQVQAWHHRGCPDEDLELLWYLDTGYGSERRFARAIVPGAWPSLASSHSPLDYTGSPGYSTYDLAPGTSVSTNSDDLQGAVAPFSFSAVPGG